MRKGLLIVLSGFSGAGKGTVMKRVVEKYDNYALSISATTRNPRPGETDGKEYFFKTKEEFEEMIKNNRLLEHAQYVGNYYGTPKDYVEKMREEGKDVILEIEIQGALKVKKEYPDAILMFLMTKDANILKNRLVGRGTEDESTVNARMSRAIEESEGVEEYDYIIINDELEKCVEDFNSIVIANHAKAENNLDKIKLFREELKGL